MSESLKEKKILTPSAEILVERALLECHHPNLRAGVFSDTEARRIRLSIQALILAIVNDEVLEKLKK